MPLLLNDRPQHRDQVDVDTEHVESRRQFSASPSRYKIKPLPYVNLPSFFTMLSSSEAEPLETNPSTPNDNSLPGYMTEFIEFLSAPYERIEKYNKRLVPDEQLSTTDHNGHNLIPLTFVDAMRVREIVFVKEQNKELEDEFDMEDGRSYHWVAYASVGVARQQLPPQATAELPPLTFAEQVAARIPLGVALPENATIDRVWSRRMAIPGTIPGFFGFTGGHMNETIVRNAASTATRVPIGTIRIIPPLPVYIKAASYDMRPSVQLAISRRASFR
jgi:hypothetical protein